MLFFPSCLFGILEYCAVGKNIVNFLARKVGEYPRRDVYHCHLFLYLYWDSRYSLAGRRYPHIFIGRHLFLLSLPSPCPLQVFSTKSPFGSDCFAGRSLRLFFHIYRLSAPYRIVPRPGRRRLWDTGEITGRPCFPRAAAEDSSTEKTAPWGGFLSGSREF